DPAWLASARNVSAEPVSAPDGTALVGTADYGVVARGANAVATNGRLTLPCGRSRWCRSTNQRSGPTRERIGLTHSRSGGTTCIAGEPPVQPKTVTTISRVILAPLRFRRTRSAYPPASPRASSVA